jgi:predicted component of type VI protein secretion system
VAKLNIKKTPREMAQIIKYAALKSDVVYAIERDVANPFGDRRIRDDWRQEPMFVEGTRFYPQTHEGKIRLAGPGVSDIFLTVDDPLYYEILPALVEAQPSVTDVLRTNGFIDPVRVLDALIENKVVSMENLLFGVELVKEVDARRAKAEADATAAEAPTSDAATSTTTPGAAALDAQLPAATETKPADGAGEAKPADSTKTGNRGNGKRGQNQATA